MSDFSSSYKSEQYEPDISVILKGTFSKPMLLIAQFDFEQA